MRSAKVSAVIVMILGWFAVVEGVTVCQRSRCNYFQSAKKLFGAVVQQQTSLFEVNNEYALQLQLAKNCEMSKIEVSPKYFWEAVNPLWKDPGSLVGLSQNEYERLLEKADHVKRIGALVHKGTIGTVTNSKLWLWDRYENAFVQRGMLSSSADQASLIHSFSVYYLHSLEGKIENRDSKSFSNAKQYDRLRIRGHWYLTTEIEFKRAIIGMRGRFRVAGPIS